MSQIDKWNWMENPEITGEKNDYKISNKNIDNIVWMYEFVWNTEILEEYDDFLDLKKEINNFILGLFKEKIEWKSDDFSRAFSFWNISLYSLDKEWNTKEEYNELFRLLIEKNKFYLDIFSKLLNWWKLNNILEKDEINDSYHVIESGILQYFDEMYYNWYQNAIDEVNQEKDDNNELELKTNDWNPIYWGLKNQKFVPYNKFVNKTELEVKSHLFDYIKNSELKQYFSSVNSFIESWVINYQSWVWIDDLAISTWQNKEGNLWLITPIENYIHKGLVEPELILFLKNSLQNNKFDPKNVISLAEEFYGKNYWMDKVTLDIVETFLEWWQSTVSGFIWKNSPNDPEQSKKLWSFILLKDSDVLDSIGHALPLFEKLLENEWLLNSNDTYNEIMKHLVYHEFGHNLFIKWFKDSLREEAKASLYYYLQLFKENNNEEYSEEKIQIVVESALIMWLRDLTRLSNPSAQKHVLRGKLILNNLFFSELIEFNWDKLEINPTKENFKCFLENNKQKLEIIKNNYYLTFDKNTQDNKECFIFDLDEDFIKKLEKSVWLNIDKMLRIVNK